MNVAEYVCRSIEARGVTHVFELIGGMITFFLDAASTSTNLRLVSMHHEQAAGFAAEGYGRTTHLPGVAMATSGPGATNLLTAIGSCYFDSSPTVFITGQVNRSEQKKDKNIRQLGFQETDIVAMAAPITKDAIRVDDPNRIPELLQHAFDLAVNGRPGPVLLDIPMDVQRASIPSDTPLLLKLNESEQPAGLNKEKEGIFCERLFEAISQSSRPLLLVGGGVRSANCASEFRKFAEKLNLPVISSLMGLDVIPASSELRVGMIGSYGNRWANIALSESDLMLVVGSRLDVRQTGSDVAGFKGAKKIFHVDCEAGELNNRVQGCDTLISGIRDFLKAMSGLETPRFDFDPWKNRIDELRSRWPDTRELSTSAQSINPNVFMRELFDFTANTEVFVTDVGQHQMWAAQSLLLSDHQRLLTSGGMGAMGFALPTAIGACLAQKNCQTVVVAGDGGFQLNIQELETIRRLGLPIKIIVVNNKCHGMVRQFQQSYFKENYQSTIRGYSAPDFTRVADAYRIPAMKVEHPKDLKASLKSCFKDPQEPFLLEVMINQMENAYPKLAFGLPISEMEPLAKSLDMEST